MRWYCVLNVRVIVPHGHWLRHQGVSPSLSLPLSSSAPAAAVHLLVSIFHRMDECIFSLLLDGSFLARGVLASTKDQAMYYIHCNDGDRNRRGNEVNGCVALANRAFTSPAFQQRESLFFTEEFFDLFLWLFVKCGKAGLASVLVLLWLLRLCTARDIKCFDSSFDF